MIVLNDPRHFLVLLIATLLSLLSYFKLDLYEQQVFEMELRNIPVEMVGGVPDFTSQDVDLALVAFGILDTRYDKKVGLDPTVHARGVAIHGSYGGDAEIKVGLAAFSSWGLLGSTLAHEIEIHVNQNPFVVWLEDLTMGTGTIRAERAAYNHEMLSRDRFGLADYTVSGIEMTRDEHYSFLDSNYPKSTLPYRLLEGLHQLTSRANGFRLSAVFFPKQDASVPVQRNKTAF